MPAKKGVKTIRLRDSKGRIIPTTNADVPALIIENQELKKELAKKMQLLESKQQEMEGMAPTAQIRAIHAVFTKQEVERFYRALLIEAYKWSSPDPRATKKEQAEFIPKVIGIKNADLAKLVSKVILDTSPKVKQVDIKSIISTVDKSQDVLSFVAKIGRSDPQLTAKIKVELEHDE